VWPNKRKEGTNAEGQRQRTHVKIKKEAKRTQRKSRQLQYQQYKQTSMNESLILSSKDDREFLPRVEFADEDEFILSSEDGRAFFEDDDSMRAFSMDRESCEQYDNMPLIHSCKSFEDWKQCYGKSVLRQVSGKSQQEMEQSIQTETNTLANRNISLCFAELLQNKDAEMASSFSQRNDLSDHEENVNKISWNSENTVEILTDGLLNNWERQWTGKDHFMEHVEAVASKLEDGHQKLVGAKTI